MDKLLLSDRATMHSIQNKVLQDADSNQKSRKDLARRLEAAEEQLRTVMQEREAAVQALTQFKSEKSREIGDMQTGMHKKDVEMKNLRKKYFVAVLFCSQ